MDYLRTAYVRSRRPLFSSSAQTSARIPAQRHCAYTWHCLRIADTGLRALDPLAEDSYLLTVLRYGTDYVFSLLGTYAAVPQDYVSAGSPLSIEWPAGTGRPALCRAPRRGPPLRGRASPGRTAPQVLLRRSLLPDHPRLHGGLHGVPLDGAHCCGRSPKTPMNVVAL